LEGRLTGFKGQDGRSLYVGFPGVLSRQQRERMMARIDGADTATTGPDPWS
jgi:hypothetical protein